MEAQANDLVSIQLLNHTATDVQIQPILNLSNDIFAAAFKKEDKSTFHPLSGWRARLDDPRSVIISLQHSILDSSNTTNNDDVEAITAAQQVESQIVGFFFALPRTQPELGFEALHIWLAGIDERFRGQRLFQRLLDNTRQHAVSSGFDYMTVCTLPEVFATMYRILQKNGWQFVAWREEEQHRKVLMKLKVN